MTKGLIPTPADVLGPAIDRLIEVRPTAAPHVETGRYGDVVAAQRGQFGVLRGQLVDEAVATRLSFAKGPALTDVAASEFETPRAPDAIAAIGEAVLTRTVVHYVAGPDLLDPVRGTNIYSLVRLSEAMNAHALDVYAAGTGAGAHASTAPPFVTDVGTFNVMGDYVVAANGLLDEWTAHLAGTPWHPDADTLTVLDVERAFWSDAADTYENNSQAAQDSVTRVVDALREAFADHTGLESKAGSSRAGSPFVVAANPQATPPIAGGRYVSTQDYPIATGIRSIAVPIRAAAAGAAGNLPAWVSGTGPTLSISTPPGLFDAGASLPLATSALRAAGGSDGQSDPELVRAARASGRGSDGPTKGALVAGVLRTLGASRTTVLESTLTGTSWVYPIDTSWAQSDRWNASVVDVLNRSWRGVGCRVATGAVRNRVVRVELSVVLRDASYLTATGEITGLIQTDLRRYFDDRQDWYVWRAAAIRGLVARTDRRISTCVSATLLDESGVPLTEPAVPVAGDDLVHYVFADNAVSITYFGPQ